MCHLVTVTHQHSFFEDNVCIKYVIGRKRESCRLDWAESSWTRWMHVAFWWWIQPILSLGNRCTLVEDDLSDISPSDKCAVLLKKANYDDSEWPGTWHVIRRVFMKDFFQTMLIMLAYIVIRIAQPLLIRVIVLYISNTSDYPTYIGYLSAIGLGVSSVLQTIIHLQVFFRTQRIGTRVRNTISCAIYKHVLKVKMASLYKTTVAQIINLISNDAGKLDEMCTYFHFLWMAPAEALVVFGLIWWNIGVPTLFGYAILVLLIPIQLVFSKLFGRYRKATMACTDKRLQTFNELINGCQIVKMYNWERAMEESVRDTRRAELKNIFKSGRLHALNIGIFFASLPLISLATFGGSWLMGIELLAANVFTALSFFSMIRVPLTAFLPLIIEQLSEARVSAKRIDQFMVLEILLDKQEKEEMKTGVHAIVMEDASFSWTLDTPCLSSLDLKIEHGTLVGVKGTISAGKSSLLAAILGEINLVNGKIERHVSSISYAPQTPWIFADTIRNNILLGKPMNEERYKNVIQACCLDVDLQNFGEVGDLMMIGEKGVNLSGGQNARVSLARALYVDADLYLLDDPLAAIDPKVAKKIFDQCIGPQSLLREKTRILVTHQTHFLEEADKTIVVAHGSIVQSSTELSDEDEQSNNVTNTNLFDDNQADFHLGNTTTDMNSIVKAETSNDGSVKWNVWLQLFTAPPLRWFGFFLLIFLLLTGEALFDCTNFWLTKLSSKSTKHENSTMDAYVFLGLTIGTLLIGLIRAGFLIYVLLCGSNYFHNRMLTGLLYTSLRFFESNPSGRILNRASKDQKVLDDFLPLTFVETIQYLLMSVGSIVLIGTINPWVLLVLVPSIPVFWWIRRYYINSSRQLKRLESTTRSSIYEVFASSLNGLTSIRAFKTQDDFLNMFMETVDTNSRAFFILLCSGYWLGAQLSHISSLITLVTSILAVALRHQIEPSAAALSLMYCIAFTNIFQWAVRQSAEVENLMTSAERIHEYGQLVPESHTSNSKNGILIKSPNDWPSHGVIEFKDYTFRYRPELNPVLKKLNLRIESKEKIGIIGRTGMKNYLY